MNKLISLSAYVLFITLSFSFNKKNENKQAWIRINQLGYTPQGIKVAVWCSKNETTISSFSLIDSASGKTVFDNNAGKNFGAYGLFTNTYRLNFSYFKKPGVSDPKRTDKFYNRLDELLSALKQKKYTFTLIPELLKD